MEMKRLFIKTISDWKPVFLFGCDIGYFKTEYQRIFLLDYTNISYWITLVFQTGLYEHFILDYSVILNWIILKFLIGLPGMRLCLCHQHRPWRWHSRANCLPTFEGKHFDSPFGPQPPKTNLELLFCFTPNLPNWS